MLPGQGGAGAAASIAVPPGEDADAEHKRETFPPRCPERGGGEPGADLPPSLPAGSTRSDTGQRPPCKEGWRGRSELGSPRRG